MSNQIFKSSKLNPVYYDIRGDILDIANQMESDGSQILKLHLGNPAAFNLNTPEEIIQDMIKNLSKAQGYCDSRGLFSARKAIAQDCQLQNIPNIDINNIYIGNGSSELILLSMQALLEDGDEVLLPQPVYPLWTASTFLAGGKPAFYHCEETNGWEPDLDHMKQLITKKTKAIVLINPNNPTGAVYSKECLLAIVEMARVHNLVIFSDEIYGKITYDNHVHIPIASLAPDVLTLTFSGLSKAYRAAGFRVGWLIVSDPLSVASDYIKGLDILASTRLCANVPGQYAVQTALGGYQSINDLVAQHTGELYRQRTLCWQKLNEIEGISCVEPKGALYAFPKIDIKKIAIHNDKQMALDLLKRKKILLVQGTAFNWQSPDHFRVVFLPSEDLLKKGLAQMKDFFENYQQPLPTES